MSKESYIRGFCKAASAAGINPNELVKFAQKFKTEGWAPEGANEKYPKPIFWGSRTDNNKIPKFDLWYENAIGPGVDNLRDIWGQSRLRYLRWNPIDQRRSQWLRAHASVLGDIADKRNLNGYSTSEKLPKSLLKAIQSDYHKGMMDMTGTPQRVSAPTKK